MSTSPVQLELGLFLGFLALLNTASVKKVQVTGITVHPLPEPCQGTAGKPGSGCQ